MFLVNEDKSMHITRGDQCQFPVTAVINGEAYQFQEGDVVRFKVFRKKDCATVVIQRDFKVEEETDTVMISLTGADTKIGEVISKPVDYWYEVELNPDTNPQTILGYDDDGPKVFKLFPEGKDVDGDDIEVVGSKTLQELVDYALEQANESGAFKGDKGDKGEKGDKGDTGDVTPEAEVLRDEIKALSEKTENSAARAEKAAGDAEESAYNKQNKLAWVTDEDIDAMFNGTYEGEENEDPEGDGYLPGGGGSITATDDGNGNVEITITGALSVTDDGNGNVVIS